jgi:hypothetical protein
MISTQRDPGDIVERIRASKLRPDPEYSELKAVILQRTVFCVTLLISILLSLWVFFPQI